MVNLLDPVKVLVRILILVLGISILSNCKVVPTDSSWSWETLDVTGEPTARHEAGLAVYDDKLYLLGGRRVNPTSVFDIASNTWSEKASPPIELHHFQAVTIDDAIYLLGAMTGAWPDETPLDSVLVYYPKKDEFDYTHPIPEHRRRGGAGASVYNGKIYLVGGITKGHMDGSKAWFDEYDPVTGSWKVLPDAPNARDHFQTVIRGDKLYAFAGRNTSRRTNQDMSLTKEYGNVYDFKSGKWSQVTTNLELPTRRAGNSAFVWNDEIIIGGGESDAHVVAHNELEAYDANSRSWRAWPSLNQGRHGTGLAVVGDYVYTASGCGNRGGEPELTTVERLKLPSTRSHAPIVSSDNEIPVYNQWHTVTLTFDGPESSEGNSDNPFLNYRLVVDFTHETSEYSIRGFYAADGDAAETSASAGNKWAVRFTPDQLGDWQYKARLVKGKDIAIEDDLSIGETIEISNAEGKFKVIRSDKEGHDFRANGRLIAKDGFFKFQGTDKYWFKAGANSPENFLAFEGFDDTYRIEAAVDEGEATAPAKVHQYAPHLKDWKSGDLSWKGGKGKGIVGAVNYLHSKEMNAIYFLTLNILGDGKDVWPYVSPDDFTRFDVSKLAQWNMLFSYMQSKGILLHLVTQETENETMLDGGDTGKYRKLYYNELIARFGHHLGLVWNLGEENGPAEFTPIAQNDAQRKAMTSYIKSHDPYNHPILLHTHSFNPPRTEVLDSILGYEDLDGLSLQVNHRKEVAEVLSRWKDKQSKVGEPWLVTMDEIGEWHTAVLPDSLDPDHPTIRQYALWGSIMSGAAGVEWYFGARYPHNDLSSEDWSQRDRLWEFTAHAKQFFDVHIPYWKMKPDHSLVSHEEGYCLMKQDEIYAVYLPDIQEEYSLDLSKSIGVYKIEWFDPWTGGRLKEGTIQQAEGGGVIKLGKPKNGDQHDWVALIKKM